MASRSLTRASVPRRLRSRLSRAVPSALCLWALGALGALGATPTAQRIVTASGIKGGLVVHLGCGDGSTTAGLRVSDSYLVHGLDPDATKVTVAREYLERLGIYGPVSIDRLRGKSLPYIDNVVNLLVMTEGVTSVPQSELLRVLAPAGVAVVPDVGYDALLARNSRPASRAGDGLALFTKPRPASIDEWTHFLHGPDGNAVAADTVVGPPRHMQWLAAPNWTRSHHKLASISAVVSARGRVFTIVDEGPAASMAVPGRWFLVARDAFSGVLLWRRPLSSWAWTGRGFRSGPVQLPRTLVAEGDRVYVPLGMNEPVSVLDAASGRTVAAYEETGAVEEIILDAGILLAIAGSPASEQAAIDPARRGQTNHPNRKTIVAVRTGGSGRVLWTHPESVEAPYMPLTLAAADERVVFQAGEDLVCLARETGKPLWNWRRSGEQGRESGKARKPRRVGWSVATLVLHDGVVLWADAGRMTALGAEDGRRLWSCSCREGFKSPTDVFVVDGIVWLGPGLSEGRDLRTGAVTRTSSAVEDTWTAGHHHRCYREKATSRYILSGYRGIEFLDLAGGNHSRNNWIRGVCQYGIMPCNGLIYAPAHACGCYMEAKLFGFWAAAPARAETGSGLRVQEVQDRRLQIGPAYRLATAAPELRTPSPEPNGASSSWPTYRHDPRRSGSTSATLHPAIEQVWETEVGGRLTAPVVAQGLVVTAAVDAHRVVGLDAASGRTRWCFTAGGRVDSPPTLYAGLVLFGCADGWVYCLRGSDGQEAWRFRAAPTDQRTVAMDGVESVWPAHGSVLVDGGVAYIAAGRSSYLDGGIGLCALDPATGRILHGTAIRTEHPRPRSRDADDAQARTAVEQIVQNATDHKTFTDPDASDAFSMAGGATADVLVGDGTSVFLRHLRFDRACVQQETKLPHLFSTSRLLDDAEVHRSHWVLGTGDFSRVPVAYSWIANAGGWRDGTRLAVPYGLMLAFDSETAWGVRRRNGYTLYAETRQPSAPGQEHLPDFRKKESKDGSAWRWSGVLGLRPRAMLQAGGLLVLAGVGKDIDSADPYATFDSEAGGLLWTVTAKDGMRMAETRLASPPVWDGMAVVDGRLYLATVSGHVVCMGADESAQITPVKLATPPRQRARAGRPNAQSKPGPPGTPGKPVEPDEAGAIALTPATARTTGRLCYQPDRDNLGAWVDPRDVCQWNLQGVKAGTYTVTFAYGSTNPDVEYVIAAGERELRGRTEHTGGIKTYKAFEVGRLELPGGRVTLTIKPGPFKGAIMNFRLLTLTPVE